MDNIKTLNMQASTCYSTNEKVKDQFNELVELGKKEDLEGKYY